MVKPALRQPLSELPMFFIIGRPRSGTTMLRLLFEAHPHVTIPPESPLILSLYKKYGRITLWNAAVIKDYADDVFKQRYFDKWLVEKDDFLKHMMEVEGVNTYQNIVKKTCLAYQSVYEKQDIRLIGDKNPGYSLYIGRIHKIFPEAKIIHITRDYRDNYLSLTNVNFEVPIVPLVVFRWKFALQQAWKLKKHHPDLVYSIKYEDLAADPEKHFRELCRFTGIDYDPAVMLFHEKKSEIEKAYTGSQEIGIIHKSLMNPISTQRMNLWKTQMSRHDIRVADLVAGKTAGNAGYQREFKSFNLFLYLWILPTLIYGWVMYRLLLLGDYLPYRMRNSVIRLLGIFLKVYWKINKRKVKPLS